MDTVTGSSLQRRVQWAGVFAGPLLALIVFAILPKQYTDESGAAVAFTAGGRATLGVMVWMGVWWLTEAIEISATALLPLVVFPLLGIADIKAAAAPYAHDLIFLFMGGFLLALSMQRWGLDRRIALITLRLVGTRPANMIGGFMLATAVLSACVSNTATTAMMLPIALSVIALLRTATGNPEDSSSDSGPGGNFPICLMLGIAYAASIGGIATIIGTPPNGILVAYLQEDIAEGFAYKISFARWLLVGVPLAAVFLPITWLLLTRVLYRVRTQRIEGARRLIDEQYRELGPTTRGEWITLIVFGLTALLWIIRPLLAGGIAGPPDPITGKETFLLAPLLPGLSDAGIAITGGLLLFLIPVEIRTRTFTLNWNTARKLPWGILILFGGGLSLAAAVKTNGVAQFIANQMPGLELMSDLPWLRTFILVLLVTTAVIFLTELTSNTATTAALVPILAPVAIAFDIHPYLLVFAATLAASCAFMMPVATPPNAIVFGSGYITIPQMCRAGFWLNLIGIALVVLLAMLLLPLVLPM